MGLSALWSVSTSCSCLRGPSLSCCMLPPPMDMGGGEKPLWSSGAQSKREVWSQKTRAQPGSLHWGRGQEGADVCVPFIPWYSLLPQH